MAPVVEKPLPNEGRFREWLVSHCGAYGIENAYIGEFPHGDIKVRGIGARKAIAKNKHVFCIPKKCWFREGIEPPELLAIVEKFGEGVCSDAALLGLYLAEEEKKGTASVWAPYLETLPTTEDYKAFHPGYLENFTLKAHVNYWPTWTRAFQKCFQAYKDARGDATTLTMEDARRAAVIVFSRRFADTSLVPFADMPNTVPNGELSVAVTHDGDSPDDPFCFKAKRDLAPGDELTVAYGANEHSAMMNFALYGFTFDPKDHDKTDHGFGASVKVDGCAGLGPDEFQDPGSDADPIHQAYWRFAQKHCHPKHTRLVEWAVDYCKATDVDRIFFGEFAHGEQKIRGIGIKDDLPAGEHIFCIPQKCWFREGTESPGFLARLEGLPADHTCNDAERFALYLAEEEKRGSNSKMAPYIDMLPTIGDYKQYHPAYLEDMQLTYGLKYWESWYSGMDECFKAYKALHGANTRVTGKDARKAVVQVFTRRYANVAMVPIADMLNTVPARHLNVAVETVGEEGDQTFCMKSKRALTAGEELYVSYGSDGHSASMNFALYGFSFDPADHDPEGHGFDEGSKIDGCDGLYPDQFEDPGADANPIHRAYWLHAQKHCHNVPRPKRDTVKATAVDEASAEAAEEETASTPMIALAAAGAVVVFALFCKKIFRPAAKPSIVKKAAQATAKSANGKSTDGKKTKAS